ncbi:MAG: 2-succinyl-5-enolpyruvyl-6-hydroxy-3-cyclohexene-1-carboxylic-acid synthase, partial [Cyclobacteriaceae bacterium]|nr:2-succinyl-5-enolpyruvyl-6-hydroxy-3-cyclohexene-1-carboxylic-acid synthase [Cyclobacteriaceae bacterium]
AVAEAFYSHVPLLVLTADRPAEWIDQLDGQTIRQPQLYGNHVKRSIGIPQELAHADALWHANRLVNEAVQECLASPAGPVHLNFPFREPLYPGSTDPVFRREGVRTIDDNAGEVVTSPTMAEKLKARWAGYSKIMVVAGQQSPDSTMLKVLDRLVKKQQVVVVGDIISNLHSVSGVVRHADGYLAHLGAIAKKSLQPELLVTVGRSVISKNLKLFLRQHPALEHWHVQPEGVAPDTFQQLTEVIHARPEQVLQALSDAETPKDFDVQKRTNYVRLWQAEENRFARTAAAFFDAHPTGEFALVRKLLQALPSRCNLHLANSMTVRYANFVGLSADQVGVHVFSNRGTSGIDGCTSTAVGQSLVTTVPNVLVTGDMAFFYDRNAFWHPYPLPNLHVVVINNHGGVIFNLIDGPGNLPEKDKYFITQQSLSAASLASEFNFAYSQVKEDLKGWEAITRFEGKTKILEVEGQQASARSIFEAFKLAIRKSYES